MNLWGIVDLVVVGWKPLAIDGTFSRDETVARLRDLNHDSSTTAFPLTALVDGDSVVAYYQAKPEASAVSSSGNTGIVHFLRPIFRGRLTTADGVRLSGAFSAGWIVRWLGLAAIVVALFMLLGSIAPALAAVGYRFWGVLLVFVGACIATRINGGDDMRLIANNLTYALRGDD